jgi:hypothetical protein
MQELFFETAATPYPQISERQLNQSHQQPENAHCIWKDYLLRRYFYSLMKPTQLANSCEDECWFWFELELVI